MRIPVQYVSSSDGWHEALWLPIKDWEKVLEKIKKYEQASKLKADLKEAFAQVDDMKNTKANKQTLEEFLNDFNVIPSDRFKKRS